MADKLEKRLHPDAHQGYSWQTEPDEADTTSKDW